MPTHDPLRLHIQHQRECIAAMGVITSQNPLTQDLYHLYSWGNPRMGIRAGSIPPLKSILRSLPEDLRQPFQEVWASAGWGD